MHSSPAPRWSTVVELLRTRAWEQPKAEAYRFVAKGVPDDRVYDYEALDLKARAIAASLQAHGAHGERVLIVVPQGLEYVAAFFGCLYAGAIAVPTYPPISSRQMGRVEAVARDAGARFLISTARVRGMIAAGEAGGAPSSLLARLIAIDADAVDARRAADWVQPVISPSTTAFLQYTSGSSAAPKGVIVSHQNIAVNERMIEAAFETDASSIIVGWLPLFHDMGLIGNILHALHLGVPSILMSPLAFIQKPVSWLRAISRFRGTTSGAPNFAYQMCVDAITDEEKAGLDLSSWRTAYNGAEPIHAETLRRFSEAFAVCGFRPEAFHSCYGMAEATLLITGGGARETPKLFAVDAEALEGGLAVLADPADAGEGRSARVLVGCGRAQGSEDLRIVDPETGIECEDGRVGEIWIAGGNVAGGYWNRPEETAATFGARIAGNDAKRFLRTGDLGFLVEDRQLVVVGRRKDLIIIRGRKHAPQDIELSVEGCHAAVRPTCVTAFSVGACIDVAPTSATAGPAMGSEQLVLVVELRRERMASFGASEREELERAIRRAVASRHELEPSAILVVAPGSVPKTSSGKLQRQACKKAFVDGAFVQLATGAQL